MNGSHEILDYVDVFPFVLFIKYIIHISHFAFNFAFNFGSEEIIQTENDFSFKSVLFAWARVFCCVCK